MDHDPHLLRASSRLLVIVASAALTLTACGNDGPDIPTPAEKAKMYGKQLTEELANSDLTPEQAGCVESGVWDTWDPVYLAEARHKGIFYENYFRDVDSLEFSDMPVTVDGGNAGMALYDIVTGCGVNLRRRAVEMVTAGLPLTASHDARVRCAKTSTTEEAMRDHWERHLLGRDTDSAFEVRVSSGCTRSLDELLNPEPPDQPDPTTPSPSPYTPPEETTDGEDFCMDQYELVWQMYRDGQLSETDYLIQRQELEDACIGL